MRALWITQVYPRFEDDLWGSFLHRLARELPSRGVSVTVIAPGADDVANVAELDGVRVRRFTYGSRGQQTLAYTGAMHHAVRRSPARLVKFLSCCRRAIAKELDESKFDVIHEHWWIPSGLASKSCAGPRISRVLSSHGTDIRLAMDKGVLRPLARWVFRGTSLVLPVSDALARDMDAMRLGGGKRVVLPMPIDTEIFTTVPSQSSVNPVRFVAASRLTEQKRVHLAIKAVAELAREGIEVGLDVAGDGPERGSLEALARGLGLESVVRFHGLLPPAELAALFRSSRALIVPSDREGFGLTVLEAGACGIPTIGARSGALVDTIGPESGALFPPGDSAALAVEMARLATDEAEAGRLGSRARERALGSSPGVVADRLVSLYHGLPGADAPA